MKSENDSPESRNQCEKQHRKDGQGLRVNRCGREYVPQFQL